MYGGCFAIMTDLLVVKQMWKKKRKEDHISTAVAGNDTHITTPSCTTLYILPPPTTDNKQSLVVDFEDLAKSMGTLASWLADVPRVMLDIFNKVALDVAVETWPEYQQLAGQVFVRIANLPIVDQIRDLRCVECMQTKKTMHAKKTQCVQKTICDTIHTPTTTLHFIPTTQAIPHQPAHSHHGRGHTTHSSLPTAADGQL